MTSILRNFWYIAAPSSELDARPLGRLVEGEALVLFRDASGAPHALRDRCAHRGMALSKGRVSGDCLQCPYHGWNYDGAGRLRDIPAHGPRDPLPRIPPLPAYPVVESDGHLWVWIGEGVPPSGPFRFPHAAESGWNTFFMHTRFQAPVEACLENFLDVPHTMFVHPGLFRAGTPRPTRARIHQGPDYVEAEFLDETPLKGWGPRLVFPRGTSMRHTDRFILPSLSRVDYAFGAEHRFIITSQCTRREEDVVDVTTAITWRLPPPAWILKPFLKTYCGRVIRQDVEILRIQGEQLRRFGGAFVDTPADLLGRRLRALRRRAAEGGPEVEAAVEERMLRV